MAMPDEQKPVSDENVEPVSDEPRKGDVLGLSGSEVPKTPEDPSIEYDRESSAEHGERARAGDILGLEQSEDPTPDTGATGADTGSGASRTDVSEE
jgi:hypothetical protein